MKKENALDTYIKNGKVKKNLFTQLRAAYDGARYANVRSQEGTAGPRDVFHLDGVLNLRFDPRFFVAIVSDEPGKISIVPIEQE